MGVGWVRNMGDRHERHGNVIFDILEPISTFSKIFIVDFIPPNI